MSPGVCFDVKLSPEDISAAIDVSPNIDLNAEVNQNIEVSADISSEEIDFCVEFVHFGNRSSDCPIIDCVDGGNAYTASYPPINGFLKGGSA